jgi:hypothetical protein
VGVPPGDCPGAHEHRRSRHSQLSTDIADHKVPDYVWITPNLCRDMHMGLGCGGIPEEQLDKLGDDFIHEWVTRIMNSSAWTGNSTVFITFDEGPGGEYCCDSMPVTAGGLAQSPEVHGGGNVPLIVISRHGSRGYTNTVKYNHYSLLRTIEDNWSLEHLGLTSDSQQGHLPTPFLRESNRS